MMRISARKRSLVTINFIVFDRGAGNFIIDNNEDQIAKGDPILVPASAKHNIINSDSSALKMCTL